MLPSICIKVVHDHWRGFLAWAAFSALFAAFYLSLYPSIGAVEETRKMLDAMPPAIRAMFAAEGADIATPAGYLNVELFTFVVPLLLFAVSVTLGAGATAGEEEAGTLELLLANPVRRRRIVLEKALALVLATAALASAMWIALAAAAWAGGIDLALDRVAAALVSAALLGISIGTLAMAVGALTGKRMVSIGVALVVAVGGFFLNALGPLVEGLKAWRVVSPHYHYLGNDPLTNGIDPVHASVLAGAAVLFVLAAAVLFERRDLRA